MREDKFRFWNTQTKCMYADTGLTSLGVNDAIKLALENDYIPMLYTGLKDKSGKKIYEGDIVKREFKHNCSCEHCERKMETRYDIGEIVFNNGEYGEQGLRSVFRNIKDSEDYNLCTFGGDLEVIGNIHENPELLEYK